MPNIEQQLNQCAHLQILTVMQKQKKKKKDKTLNILRQQKYKSNSYRLNTNRMYSNESCVFYMLCLYKIYDRNHKMKNKHERIKMNDLCAFVQITWDSNYNANSL